MANPQLAPLEVNPRTGEPFLRLRKHKNIIITPPREEVKESYIKILNDVRVYDWLTNTPFPYRPEDADFWSNRVIADSDKILSELAVAQHESQPILATGCPVRALREVKEDGTDIHIGEIGMERLHEARLLALPRWEDVTEEEKAEALKKNDELPLGDESIWFHIGDYLAPSHHGQGIMSDAVDTLLWEWGVPRMGIHRVRTSAFQGNHGSVRVFEKNGFVVTQTLQNYIVTRGKMRNLHVIEWERSRFGDVDSSSLSA